MVWGTSIVLLIILFVFGCASEPDQVDLPPNHASNPEARETAFIPPPNPLQNNIPMAEHAEHVNHMAGPQNTLMMMMGKGLFGTIEMGGMFTMVKVRDRRRSYDEDPGGMATPKEQLLCDWCDQELSLGFILDDHVRTL